MSGETAAGSAHGPKLWASFNYLLPDARRDAEGYYAGSAGTLRRRFDARDFEVADIRDTIETFRLDEHGFQFIRRKGDFGDFDNWFRIIDQYYPEVNQLVKMHTGATHVRAVQHLVRNETYESALAEAEGKADIEPVSKLAPGRLVHVDQSYAGARGYMEEFVGREDAETLSKTRWAIVNVWRPIKTATRDPLAVCDARSVSEADLCPISVKKPKNSRKHVRDMETWQVYANPQHRWYYASRMTPEEAYLIKIYDSKEDGVARRTPHSAFALPEQLLSDPPRQSVEVRCLVFWQNEETR